MSDKELSKISANFDALGELYKANTRTEELERKLAETTEPVQVIANAELLDQIQAQQETIDSLTKKLAEQQATTEKCVDLMKEVAESLCVVFSAYIPQEDLQRMRTLARDKASELRFFANNINYSGEELNKRLAAERERVREMCAKVCDVQANKPECPERATYCAEEIRNLTIN